LNVIRLGVHHDNSLRAPAEHQQQNESQKPVHLCLAGYEPRVSPARRRPDGRERSSNLFLYHDFLTAPSVMQPEMLLGFKFVLE
jgi:hypothetical protein